MRITKIEKQKKDKSRYNIFLEGDFSFGLYDDSVLKFGLRTGDELDDGKITEIKEYDKFNFGKKIAYSFLSYRQRSKKELSQKLREKKITAPVIDKIISLLEDQKYIDDKAYAKFFIDIKLSSKPMGKRLLQNKLSEKGIDKETTEMILTENYTEDKEIESARILLRKYSSKIKGKDEHIKKQKCYRYLISRGFSFDIVNIVVNKEQYN